MIVKNIVTWIYIFFLYLSLISMALFFSYKVTIYIIYINYYVLYHKIIISWIGSYSGIIEFK